MSGVLTDDSRVTEARAARAAVTGIFVLHGLLFASWTAHVPQVKAQLGLTDALLGLALLGAPVGSLVAVLLSGPLISRWGSRAVVLAGMVGYCLSGPLVGLAESLPHLFAALGVWGAFQALLDVAMNAQGIAAERARGRAIMSTLHGSWSIGALAGAGVGVVGVAAGVGLASQLLVAGLICMVLGLWLTRFFVPDPPPQTAERSHRVQATKLLLVLGVVAFAGLLVEGAVADWAAVYLRETLRLAPGASGLGYAACAAAMVVVRLSGAGLQAWLGPRAVVAAPALLGTAGMAAGLATGRPVLAIAGFGALGAGLAAIIPVAFSAAGNQPGIAPGSAVATVTAVGWVGFLCGPPAIGFLAEQTSQTVALSLLPVLMLLITALAWFTPALDRAATAPTGTPHDPQGRRFTTNTGS